MRKYCNRSKFSKSGNGWKYPFWDPLIPKKWFLAHGLYVTYVRVFFLLLYLPMTDTYSIRPRTPHRAPVKSHWNSSASWGLTTSSSGNGTRTSQSISDPALATSNPSTRPWCIPILKPHHNPVKPHWIYSSFSIPSPQYSVHLISYSPQPEPF
jgi:hypothetical protein